MIQLTTTHNKKKDKLFHIWMFFEAFKLLSLIFIVSFPYSASNILFFIVWIWCFVIIFVYIKELQLFREIVNATLNIENERTRLLFCKNRNILIGLFILDLVPFFIFPNLYLRYKFWKNDLKIRKHLLYGKVLSWK